jgi:hypothetical protein
LTDLLAPGPLFQTSLMAPKCKVKTKVVPLPSERVTTVILDETLNLSSIMRRARDPPLNYRRLGESGYEAEQRHQGGVA